MEFISLAETVALIAVKIDLPPRLGGVFDRLQFNKTDGKYVENFLNANNIHVEWARKYSMAAKWLNQELHTSKNKKPTWLIHDEDMQIIIENEAIRDEGIKLLSHAMKWGNYRDSRCDAILYNAHSSGRFDLLPGSRIEDEEGKHVWPDGSILRAQNIKFYRDEIFDFLKNCDIDYLIEGDNQDTREQTENESIIKNTPARWGDMTRRHKIDYILEEIRNIGHDPHNTIIGHGNTKGTSGLVFDNLSKKFTDLPSKGTFNKYWASIRNEGHITVYPT